jgi:hypothetical protein
MYMTAEEYYWSKTVEALEQSDREPHVRRFYVAVAEVYRSLADGERRMQSWFPHLGPRARVAARVQ